MKSRAMHKMVGRPGRTKCGTGEHRQWLRFRSMTVTATRGKGVTCKRCLKN